MTLRRAALYVGGASLLIAWFSSAASISMQRASRSMVGEDRQADAVPGDLAAEVQAQAKRFRQRLAAAPLPQEPSRNPFTFRPTAPRPRQDAPAALPPQAAVPELPSEPALTLIGIAEQKRGETLVRTAILTTAADDLIMAAVGETVVQRYKLTAIGHDTAELTDLATGQLRRVSMQ